MESEVAGGTEAAHGALPAEWHLERNISPSRRAVDDDIQFDSIDTCDIMVHPISSVSRTTCSSVSSSGFHCMMTYSPCLPLARACACTESNALVWSECPHVRLHAAGGTSERLWLSSSPLQTISLTGDTDTAAMHTMSLQLPAPNSHLEVKVAWRFRQDHVVLCVRKVMHPRRDSARAQRDFCNLLALRAARLAPVDRVFASDLCESRNACDNDAWHHH